MALRVITAPMPVATTSACSTCCSLARKRSAAVSSTAGRMPQAPAVGAAQMRPIPAFTSLEEKAIAIMWLMSAPISPAP